MPYKPIYSKEKESGSYQPVFSNPLTKGYYNNYLQKETAKKAEKKQSIAMNKLVLNDIATSGTANSTPSIIQKPKALIAPLNDTIETRKILSKPANTGPLKELANPLQRADAKANPEIKDNLFDKNLALRTKYNHKSLLWSDKEISGLKDEEKKIALEANTKIKEGISKQVENASSAIGAMENVALKAVPEAGKIVSGIIKAPQLESSPFYSVKKIFRRILDSKALEKYGDDGKLIFNKIKTAEKEAVISKSDAIVRIDDSFKDLSDVDFKNFGDYVEGKINVPDNARKSVETWKEISSDIAQKAGETNLHIKLPDGTKVPFSARDNYFPYFVKEDILKEAIKTPEKYSQFLEEAAAKSNTTPAKMHEIISDMINGRAGYEGHLERARTAKLPMDFYERDPRKILSGYISNSYDRISEARQFGGDDKILQDLIENARVNGGDFEEIQTLTNRALGREIFNKDFTKVSQFARQYNNLTKLSLAGVTNLGDITKPFIRSGITPTLKAIFQSFTKEGKQAAARAGVIEPVLTQFAKEQGLGENFFKFTGFQATETKIRQISANAAKNYVDVLFGKLKKNPDNVFAARRLEQFGLDAKELLERGLRPSDYVEASYKAIADTQPVSKLDIPYYWQSPGGKILTQYKTFAYKQMNFAKEFIWDEAKQGNIKPLLTFVIAGSAVGEVVGDMKAWVRGGRERPDDVGRRVMDNLLTIGGIGLVSDFMSNLQYGTMGGGFLKFVAGPTLSDIDAWITAAQGDISTAIKDDKNFAIGKLTEKGESQPKVLKKVVNSVPLIGPALANKMFPTRSEYKARTIPVAEEILQITEENKNFNKPKLNKPNMNKPKMNKPSMNKPQ